MRRNERHIKERVNNTCKNRGCHKKRCLDCVNEDRVIKTVSAVMTADRSIFKLRA